MFHKYIKKGLKMLQEKYFRFQKIFQISWKFLPLDILNTIMTLFLCFGLCELEKRPCRDVKNDEFFRNKSRKI